MSKSTNISTRFPILESSDEKMRKSIDGAIRQLQTTFKGLRVGRASPSLLDSIVVHAYGNMEKLKNMATITVSDNRSLVVKVYDESLLKAVEKAISESDMGLNPVRDSNMIRIPVPELNTEQRKLLARKVNEHTEDAKISVREVRRHMMDDIKSYKKSGDLSEDEAHTAEKEVQDFIDKIISEIDTMSQQKQSDVMKV